jgi:hypothetical protein
VKKKKERKKDALKEERWQENSIVLLSPITEVAERMQVMKMG